MKEELVTPKQKAKFEKIINQIWRAMVGGFQRIDPSLAGKWWACQPAGFGNKEQGRCGLAMHCKNYALSITVEQDERTGLYLIGSRKDGSDQTDPITVTGNLDDIAQAIVDYMAQQTAQRG